MVVRMLADADTLTTKWTEEAAIFNRGSSTTDTKYDFSMQLDVWGSVNGQMPHLVQPFNKF